MEQGQSPEVIVKALGLSRACIYNWIAKYREGGVEALRASPSLALAAHPITPRADATRRWVDG